MQSHVVDAVDVPESLRPIARGVHDAPAAIEARGIWRAFPNTVALSGVSLSVRAGEVHALLGPNGAGKTTLVRILTGLLAPTHGTVRVLGLDASKSPRELRKRVGFVPSGDRSLYLRVSGLENLAFFARLHGFSKKRAFSRALEVLENVGLRDAANVQAALYSHGMQKRLAVARALLVDPAVLIVDEATHDLDPDGAQRVRGLIADAASRGAAVVWTTQRIEEIRGFCPAVTLIHEGTVRFSGSVAQLMSYANPRHFIVQLENSVGCNDDDFGRALAGVGTLERVDSSDSFLLTLERDAILGDALAALTSANLRLINCAEARPRLEEAFLALTAKGNG
jgi:ABC-2 type transport system ATP-binding protein